MNATTTADKLTCLRLAAASRFTAAQARIQRSLLGRWRFGPAIADPFVILPQDLRTPDRSLADELAAGQFGLAGHLAHLGQGTLFDVAPPSEAWSTELHGFGWLRDLRAQDSDTAHGQSVRIVQTWINRFGHTRDGLCWRPAVTARRIISWITNAAFLLDDAGPAEFARFSRSLGAQIVFLAASWKCAEGSDRLLALIARALADACLEQRAAYLAGSMRDLAAELDQQFDEDGGHKSRNPQVLVDVLLDLLPLLQCLRTRDLPIPPPIEDIVARMMPMLRFMRLGNGGLARFNGVGPSTLDLLTTVLGYDRDPEHHLSVAPQSRYARLTAGPFVLIADVGPPPPLVHAGRAHAGCLSFELSIGDELVFANTGAPGPVYMHRAPVARSTAGHNTLGLADKSSAHLVRHRSLADREGGVPIVMSGRVEHRALEETKGAWIEASHTGYFAEYGLIHTRRLAFDDDGRRLVGMDRLSGSREGTRLKRDVPFAIRFHIPSTIRVSAIPVAGCIDLRLKSGATWRFRSTGASMVIEESVELAQIAGPRNALQIVLRGASFGETQVEWSLSQANLDRGPE